MRRSRLVPYILLPLLAACAVGPDYRRPAVPLPDAYRGEAAKPGTLAAPSFGDLAWWQLFGDPALQELVRTALAANYDLRVAVTRTLQARAQLTIARAPLFPQANAAADAQYTRYTGGSKPPLTPKESFTPEGGLNVSWELDLWGRLRRASESAQADLLATDETRRGVVISVIAQVAQGYFDLRSLDAASVISRRTLVSRQQSLELTRARMEGGLASMLDVRQAEALTSEAARTIPDIERQIEQTENAINFLLGKPPAAIPRGRPLVQQVALPTAPAGVPSDLLARRPDIRQAEEQLISANAQIGAAKGLLFPTVLITGFAGAGGAVANGTTFGPFGIFSALPSVSLPIFNAGQLLAGVDLAEARTQEAVLRYQQAIDGAVREVADALVEVRKRREFRLEQEKLVVSLQDASAIATMRYEGGVSSYLEVLDTETRYFSAELQLVQAQLDESVAVVRLYKSLGGGWQAEEPSPAGH